MTMTAEQLAQLREEFEQWAEQVGALPWGILKQHRKQDGSYPGPHYTYMWEAYQAAHAALLDELERKDKRIAELKAKLETADKLQDSAFRHGLQHGFSYGQTNDQSGYEQCLKSYSSGGKNNG
ncbi:hypothetical protein FHC77_06715 [Atlantibacter hermannii]|uniref:ead/Ea22-like family protein n=1 Tax=Atlantibacter hermannii TaxID=565 RepID=UPI001C70A6BB|nr:ead/Ea22-like family protein [Atlantibacter hermannii]MBW9430437.1 hypothetical protein [Atlantibacter hermannii]